MSSISRLAFTGGLALAAAGPLLSRDAKAQEGSQAASVATLGNEHDLTVSGEAVAVIPVSGLQLTITMSQTSQTAGEASRALDEREKRVRDALAQSGVKSPLTVRGQRLTSSANAPAVLKAGIAVTVQRDLLLRLERNEGAGAVVDRLLAIPETTITDQLPLPAAGGDELEGAIATAVDQAKAKAESVAKQLGAPLGRILSLTVTEEPDGAAIREQMQEGIPPGKYGDRLVKVFVVARFQLP